jgi:phosphoribosylanthranilate isomerase
MIVKVCGMHQEDNVLQLIQHASPDLMGMIFYEKSPRFVEQDRVESAFFKNLAVQKVGVFVNADLEFVIQKVEDYGLDYVQLHGDEDLDYIMRLRLSSPIKIIKVVRVGDEVDWDALRGLEAVVDLFLFDTQTEKFGGSGKQFDWSILERYPFQKDFLLSGGVNNESLGTIQALAIKQPHLIGVDINSKFENENGLKDINKIKAFVEQCRGSLV